jgi:hypothetical protein
MPARIAAALPSVHRLMDYPIHLAGRREAIQNRSRAVRRGIVDRDDLDRERHAPHPLHQLGDGPLLVVDRNDHRQPKVGPRWDRAR